MAGDTVGYGTLMIGAAFTPMRSRNLSLGVAFLAGGQIYTDSTLQGFKNDMFDATWIYELSLDVAYRRVGR